MCGNSVEENINSLSKIIKDLNPSTINFQQEKQLFFSPVKRFFNKIKKQETIIEVLLKNLNNEREILNRDNITLEIEINNLKELIKKINIEIEKGTALKDEILETSKANNNANKEKFYTQNIIEPLEKKLYDLKQIIIIKEQSVIAMEIIRRNNKEIIRNLDRIKNVTIVALNTAVMVSKSLYHQNIVLNKIKVLENETGSVIQGTSKVLKNDGNKIYKTALQNNQEDELKLAFENAVVLLNEVTEQNQKTFPENEAQIIEIKKLEDGNE